MPTPVRQRRASYGPTSPLVGHRGQRTRDRIRTETVGLIASVGYHDTTVLDIAQAADVSRATLYQYFASKDAILADLLDECGRDLLRVIDSVGPLGPTPAGTAELRDWLVGWAGVYRRYAALFARWTDADVPGTPFAALVAGLARACHRRIAAHYRAAGVAGLDPYDAAVVTTAIVHRHLYVRLLGRSVRRRGGEVDAEVAAELTPVLQRLLFPRTPPRALGTPPAAPCRHRRPSTPRSADPDRLGTTRGAATYELLLTSGLACFATRGFHGTSVDDVVRRAGLARGTFYKHLTGRLDLLRALSDRSEARFADLVARLRTIESSTERRAWMREFLAFRAEHIGVLRTWIDRVPADPALADARRRLARDVHDTVRVLAAQSVPVPAAETVVIGVLERLPDAVPARYGRDRLADLMATVLERAVTGRQP